jgi:hypothetical protein
MVELPVLSLSWSGEVAASAGNQGDWESLVGGMDFAAELGRAWGMNTKYPRRPVCVLAEGEEDGPPED